MVSLVGIIVVRVLFKEFYVLFNDFEKVFVSFFYNFKGFFFVDWFCGEKLYLLVVF